MYGDDKNPTDLNQPKNPQREMEQLQDRISQCRQIIHSAAQPLTSIMTLLDLISTNPNLDEEVSNDITTVYEQAMALKQLFHQLQETMSGRGLI